MSRAGDSAAEIREMVLGNRQFKTDVHPPHGSGNCRSCVISNARVQLLQKRNEPKGHEKLW